MGTARIEIYRKGSDGHIVDGPFQTAKETTSTTATVTGSRITVAAITNYKNLTARITHDEACWVSVNVDPTGDAPILGWVTQPGVPLHIPCKAGDKFSFKELA